MRMGAVVTVDGRYFVRDSEKKRGKMVHGHTVASGDILYFSYYAVKLKWKHLREKARRGLQDVRYLTWHGEMETFENVWQRLTSCLVVLEMAENGALHWCTLISANHFKGWLLTTQMLKTKKLWICNMHWLYNGNVCLTGCWLCDGGDSGGDTGHLALSTIAHSASTLSPAPVVGEPAPWHQPILTQTCLQLMQNYLGCSKTEFDRKSTFAMSNTFWLWIKVDPFFWDNIKFQY